MSKKKEKPILADKIAELYTPRQLLDPEVDSEDETTARAFDYDLDDDNEPISALSDFRKKNVKLLADVDAKYRGKVASRKDFDMDSNESDEFVEEEGDESAEDEQVEEEEEEEEEDKSTEKSIDEFSMMLTPRQRIKMAQQTVGSEEENEIESAESSDDEANLKAFASKLKKSKSAIVEESESDGEIAANGNDELEKWDDDYEGEEVEEEQSDDELDEENDEDADGEEDEFNSDEEESDFDGGDIIHRETKEPTEKPDLSRILPKPQAVDSLSKGFCVQNQLQIWEKLLEVRIHSHKTLIKANSLPEPSKFEKLSTNAEFSELATDTVDQVSQLVSQMRNLQSLLLKQYTETKEIAAKRKPIQIDDISYPEAKRTRLADELEKDYSNFKEYQYSVISKWHDRTKVLTPGSIKTQKQQGNIDVLRKIEGVLANREELIKKSHLLKGGYELFDKSTGFVEKKQFDSRANDEDENNEENANNQEECTYSNEVYDDTDFYHTQLRELIEYKTSSSSNANEMAKQFSELQKLRKKMKKTVDTRASKGRKIRYVVHNKLVSFMAPNDPGVWSEEQKNELFKSLFGAQQ
ncbi:protein Aatf-like [Contarinia nasturtii]|uniref:protein Aatf-like n=1 Tax=Contarinia nasturtii TaxID=265458 RepID=UPI0012D4760A|nr:protein Aatf-like [Contarinia nasturtii]